MECAPINDGVGARFFGNCNPNVDFCCYVDEAHPERGCTYPYDGDGVPRTGTCQPASTANQSCSFLWPLQLCVTGFECGSADTCFEPDYVSLALGEQCVDDSATTIGYCAEGWCDRHGTKRCEPLEDNGEECTDWTECAGGACVEGGCADTTLCTGAE